MRAYALYVAYVLHPTQLHVELSLVPTTLVVVVLLLESGVKGKRATTSSFL